MSIINNFSGGGSDTSIVTATANDVRFGKTIVDREGNPIVGGVPTRGVDGINYDGSIVFVQEGIYDTRVAKAIPQFDVFTFNENTEDEFIYVQNNKIYLHVGQWYQNIYAVSFWGYSYINTYNALVVSGSSGDFFSPDLTRSGKITFAFANRSPTFVWMNNDWKVHDIDGNTCEFEISLGNTPTIPDRTRTDFRTFGGLVVYGVNFDH